MNTDKLQKIANKMVSLCKEFSDEAKESLELMAILNIFVSTCMVMQIALKSDKDDQ